MPNTCSEPPRAHDFEFSGQDGRRRWMYENIWRALRPRSVSEQGTLPGSIHLWTAFLLPFLIPTLTIDILRRSDKSLRCAARGFIVQALAGYAGLAVVPTSIGLAAHLAVAHLERQGMDPGTLLASSGLSRAAVAKRERVKVKTVIDFLERVSRAVGDDWLGLTLAADFDLRESACFTTSLHHLSGLATPSNALSGTCG
jgi:hypothetical protein